MNSTDILEKINTTLLALDENSDEWVVTPAFVADYESLRGKRVVLVDDVIGVIANFLPEFMVATNGNFLPVHFGGETLRVVVEKILAQNADIILMDYTLSDKISGDVVTSNLRQAGFSGIIIGFSSEANKAEKFAKAGADSSIKKDNADVPKVVLEVARFIASIK